MAKTRTKTFYAWCEITLTPKVDSSSKAILERPKVKVGDTVSAGTLGVSDDEFAKLMAEGIVRSTPPPVTKRWESPKTALLRMANEALELAERGGLIDDPDADDGDDVVTDVTTADE